MKITVRSGPIPGVFSLVCGPIMLLNGSLQRNDHALSTLLYGVGALLLIMGILVVSIRSKFIVIDGNEILRFGALGLVSRRTLLGTGETLYHADNKLYLRRADGTTKKLADRWMASADDWSAMTRALDERR